MPLVRLLIPVFALLIPILSGQTATAPTITSISPSQTTTELESLTLSVNVGGTTPFTYQWYKNGAAISGATANLLSFTSLATTDEGSYTVVVTNSAGTTTGGPIILAIRPATPPTITANPYAVSIIAGGSFTVTATADGIKPFTYTWRRGNTVVSTTPNSISNYTFFTIPVASLEDAGSYTVTVSNIVGSTTSTPATVSVTAPIAPSFNSPIFGGSVSIGSSFSIWSNISGSPPLTYQWHKDGVAIANATNYYYSKPNYSESDAGSYTLVVSNSVGSATSSAAIVTTAITIVELPYFYSEPSSTSATQGGNFRLECYAGGTEPISYQWEKDGAAIPGATSRIFIKDNVTTSDAGTYRVIASNSAGSVPSRTISVSITSPLAPTITWPPESLTLETGESFHLFMGASYSGQASRQWRKNGINIPNATDYYYYKENATAEDSGNYSIALTTAYGSTVSPEAVILVRAPIAPIFMRQPASAAGKIGTSLSLTAEAKGAPLPTYQWYKDGVAITNANSASFNIESLADSDAGTYHVAAISSAGTTNSAPAYISTSVRTPPSVSSSPASMSSLPGGSLTLNATCEGVAVTAQWYKDGTPIGATSTGTSATYAIANAQASHAGTYKVVFTNSAGSVTTSEGIVTVDSLASRPLITSLSGNVNRYAGTYIILSCTARDSDATFQWYKDNVAISLATNAYHSFTLSPDSAGLYTVRVNSQSTSTTSPAIVASVYDPAITPTFAANPASAISCAGNSFSFSAEAIGYPKPTLQWKRDGVAIPGAINSTYTKSPATTDDIGTYTVTATNVHGSLTSAAATLTLMERTVYIARQPRSCTISPTSYPELAVTVNGFPFPPNAVSYQWRKNGAAIPHATGSRYSIAPPITAEAAGTYSVAITIESVTLISNDAVVNFSARATGPSITTQPITQSIVRGNPVTFQVSATGSSTLSYQWRKNGSDITGATSASYTIPAVSNQDGGAYSVVITDSIAAVASDAVALTILPAITPTITAQPTAWAAQLGETVIFTASASGSPSPTYQWSKNGTAIPGATASTLSLSNVQVGDSGNYTLTAKNIAGSATSSSANLTVYTSPFAAPTITTQPVNVSCVEGGTATFTIVASGNPTPTLRWYHGNDPVPGATTETLAIANVSNADEGEYSVVATNSQGTAISIRATLSLGHPAAGSYSGDLYGGGAWMINIGQDGVATFVAYLAGVGRAVIQSSFTVNLDGSFLIGSENNPAGTNTDFYYHGIVIGSISGNTFTGQFPALDISFTGTKAPITAAQSVAGYYTAVTIAAETSTSHLLSSSDGSVYAVMVSAGGVSFARGTADASGAFSATSSAGTLTGTLNAGSDSVRGSFTPTAGEPVAVATPSSNSMAENLFAISTRGVAGAESKTMIAGLVVSGSTSKEVLIRAIGPTLGSFGVPGTLPNPKLRLFKGETALLENDDWGLGGQADTIASASERAGAFALPSGSRDAAMITRLEPGNYTAHITTDGSTAGVGLIEVYDLSSGQTNGARMVGLSTRGEVGKDADVLIVGVYVTGSAPKKVLLRAVGPTLASFGVPGTLTDPKLELYKGDQLLRANDNWSDGADAGLLAEAFSTTGAFQLTSGSKDAALLIYLEPGAYTAKAVGVGGTTGVAIIEVYEVP